MFASKYTYKFLYLLIFISEIFCAPHLYAQQADANTTEPGLSAGESTDSQAVDTDRRIERLGEGGADEWELDLALPGGAPPATPANAEFNLPDAEQNQQLHQLLSRLAENPGSSKLHSQLNTLLADVLAQANSLMEDGSLNQAEQLLSLIQSIEPGFSGLKTSNERIKVLNEVNRLLVSANEAMASQQWVEPEKDSALYYFNKALLKDPENLSVQLGITRLQESLIRLALVSARELDFEAAEKRLLEATEVRQDQALVSNARAEIATIRQQRAVELEQASIDAMNSGEFTLADFHIIDLIALGGQQARVESLRERLGEARVYGGFEPGQIINDIFLTSEDKAPEIIIIAAGSFLMGQDGGSGATADHEQPRHRVTIEQGFALGTREVTVDEFRLFIERSGYRTAAERKGKSAIYDESAGRLNSREGITWEYDYRGKKAKPGMPVLHVNFYDAQAYVEWLSHETGKNYRLPSEAEYEYVARAGGSGTYWWGEGSPAEAVENLTGERDSSPTKRQWSTVFEKYGDGHWGPSPSGVLVSDKLVHPMGVHDIAGNVSEWTEDCWHQNYIRAPRDGTAWVNPGCERRVARGGYWASAPEQSRAAFRISAKPETYGPIVGIRIARDL